MAIAPLLVGIRTAGAAALGRLGASFRRLAANIRVAANAAANNFIARGGFPAALARIALRLRALGSALNRVIRLLRALAIAARLAAAGLRALGRAVTSVLAGFAKLAVVGGLVLAFLTPLVAVIGNAAGAVMLLAPALVAAAAGFAVWKFAMKGFSDALNATDPEELREALKKLAPNARSAALTLRDLRREWKSTQQLVQQRFWAGARDDFIAISRALQPIANRWLPKISESFANARHALRYVFTEAAKSGQLDKIMEGVHRFLSGLLATVAPLSRAFLDIAEVAAPALGDLGVKASDAATKFAEWIRQLKESGQLKDWLDRAKETLEQLKRIAENVGRAFGALFTGGQESAKGLLDNIEKLTRETADWLQTKDGQEFVRSLGDIAVALSDIVGAIRWVRDTYNDFCNWVDEATGKPKRVIRDIGAAFTGLATTIGTAITAVQTLSSWLGALTSRTIFVDIITRRSEVKGFARGMGTPGGGGGSAPKFYAAGGILQRGRLAVVGEKGPEFVRLGSTSRVFSHKESMAMAGGRGGDTWIPAPTNANRDLLRAIEKAQRRQVRTRAGGSAQRYLGAAGAL